MAGNESPILSFMNFNIFICCKEPKQNKDTRLFSIFTNCFLLSPSIFRKILLSASVSISWGWEGSEDKKGRGWLDGILGLLPQFLCKELILICIHVFPLDLIGKKGVQLKNILKFWVQISPRLFLDVNLNKNNFESLDHLKIAARIKEHDSLGYRALTNIVGPPKSQTISSATVEPDWDRVLLESCRAGVLNPGPQTSSGPWPVRNWVADTPQR